MGCFGNRYDFCLNGFVITAVGRGRQRVGTSIILFHRTEGIAAIANIEISVIAKLGITNQAVTTNGYAGIRGGDIGIA